MLYHYTNVATLALILSKRTIRFNSLDKMDDLQEQETADLKNLGRFVFVSCWTEDDEEQIPMWKMYTDLDSGVRIKLPKYPFYEYDIRLGDFKPFFITPEKQNATNMTGLKTILNIKDMIQNGYMSTGIVQQQDTLFKIVYTSDEEKLCPHVFNQTDTQISLSLNMLGTCKNKGWQFQKEWRYILRFLPLDIRDIKSAERKAYDMVGKMIKGSAQLPFSSYDLRIDDKAFSNMEIVLSPKISPGNRIIVNDLVAKYNPSARIVESCFAGMLA